MNHSEFRKKLLGREEFRKEYEKLDLAFEISKMLIRARIIKGLTQEQLADLIKTKQSGIARLENGTNLPSLRLLEKIAKAYKTDLLPPKFKFLVQEEISTKLESGVTWTFNTIIPNTDHPEWQVQAPTTPNRELAYS